jgi:ABC-type branched-subunit amino acid transport system substrate-binding protein
MPAKFRSLLAGLIAATFAIGAAARPVTLGLVAPPSEPDATSLRRGVQLAVAEANEAGEAPVRLEVRSESGQWGSVGNDAVSLICERHVDAIIAPSDGAASHLILQVAGRTRVPVASVCSDTSVTEAGVPWAVRVVPRTDQEAEALFAATRRPDGAPLHWWAVVPAGRSGKTIRRDLGTAARAATTRLDQIVEGGEPKTEGTALARAIVDAAPDGVLIWLPPEQAGTMVAALRTAGFGGRMAGPGTLDSPSFIAKAGAAANGVLVTAFRTEVALRARRERFERQYHLKYDARPDASAAAACDAARVLIGTLRRAAAGEGYSRFPLTVPTAGVTGNLHFDNSGNRTDALQVLTCREGRFVAPDES